MSTSSYITSLPVNECVNRIRRHEHPAGWHSWAEGTILTEVRGNRFRLFACGREGLRDGFALAFYGWLEKVPEGTRISGWFRMHLLTRLFLAVWFGGLVWMMGLILFLPASSWGRQAPPPLWWVLGPAVMILMGIGLLALNSRLVTVQVERVKRFLKEELEAQA